MSSLVADVELSANLVALFGELVWKGSFIDRKFLPHCGLTVKVAWRLSVKCILCNPRL